MTTKDIIKQKNASYGESTNILIEISPEILVNCSVIENGTVNFEFLPTIATNYTMFIHLKNISGSIITPFSVQPGIDIIIKLFNCLTGKYS